MTHSINIYAVFDAAIGSYGPIFECENDEAAKRVVLATVAANPSSFIALTPSHFSLFRLATLDKVDGEFIEAKEFVSGLSELLGSVRSRSRYSIEEGADTPAADKQPA